MKTKQIFLKFLISAFSILMFTNCSFVEISPSSKLPAPDLTSTSNGITISLKDSIQDIEYINLYRQDITDTVSDENSSANPIVNIGLLFPTGNRLTFVYEDNIIYKNHKYRYYARLYHKKEGYLYTNWSKGMVVVNGLSTTSDSILGEATTKYNIPTETKAKYYPNESKIQIVGTIINPNMIPDFDKYYTPALVFQSNNETQVFEVESLNNAEIFLTKFLPISFYNTDVKFVGIIGQRKIKDDSTKDEIRCIMWTELSTLPLYEGDTNVLLTDNTFRLDFKYGESGYDYSK